LRAVLTQAAAAVVGTESTATRSDVAILNEAFLRRLSEEIGADGVAEMVEIFLTDAPVRMAAIRRGLAEGADQTVRREAHALAGAASNVGLPRLSEASGALQSAVERSGVDEATVETVAAALRDSLPQVRLWAAAHEELQTTNV
jgi:HPt (histidine-containing phosphotransfer) domain-containing protein